MNILQEGFQGTTAERAARRRARRALMAMTCIVALAAALAGCGYTAGSAQSADGTSASPGGSSGPRGTTVRPCTGPYVGVTVEGQPALTLTDATPNHSGSVGVGGLVQVQRPGTWHWTLGNTTSNLVATPYQGAFDQTRDVCFWNFRARSAGSAQIVVTGTALCERGQACPAIAREDTFSVRVS